MPTLFPEIYTPSEVRKLIGFRLMSDGIMVEHYDEETVSLWWEADEESDDISNARQIKEAAENGLWAHRVKHPDNLFRFTSRLQHDHSRSYFFEWALTEEGERARECAIHHQCCNEDGKLDRDATVAFTLAQLSKSNVDSVRQDAIRLMESEYVATWLDEDWAKPIRDALAFMMKRVLVNEAGEPDYLRTQRAWLRNPSLMMLYRDEFLSLNEEWAEPLHEAIVLAIMKAPPKKAA